jgi:hypothetical protein
MGHHRILTTDKIKRRISRLLRVLSRGLSPNQFADLLADFLSKGGTGKSHRVDLSLKEHVDSVRRENKKG